MPVAVVRSAPFWLDNDCLQMTNINCETWLAELQCMSERLALLRGLEV